MVIAGMESRESALAMTPASERAFCDFGDDDLHALAQSAGPALATPSEHLAAVEDNLRIVLAHARIVAAALPAGEPGRPAPLFEP